MKAAAMHVNEGRGGRRGERGESEAGEEGGAAQGGYSGGRRISRHRGDSFMSAHSRFNAVGRRRCEMNTSRGETILRIHRPAAGLTAL
jgi:hypothetical protein